MQVKKLELDQVIPLRHRYLRQNQPIETCYWEGDSDSLSVHFGLSDPNEHEKIVGILSICKQNLPNKEDETITSQWRLRGLALEESHRGKQYALQLIQEAFDYATKQGAQLIWGTVREGFARAIMKNSPDNCTVSAPFEIPTIGTHYLIKKYLY